MGSKVNLSLKPFLYRQADACRSPIVSLRCGDRSYLEQALFPILPFDDEVNWNITGLSVSDAFPVSYVGVRIEAQFAMAIDGFRRGTNWLAPNDLLKDRHEPRTTAFDIQDAEFGE